MNHESASAETVAALASPYLRVLLWGFLAGFGGAVKYIAAVIRSPEAISNRRFLFLLGANVFISIFCGLMGAMLVSTATADWNWQIIAASAFGYTGPQSLDWIMFALRKKIEPTALYSAISPVPPAMEPAPTK